MRVKKEVHSSQDGKIVPSSRNARCMRGRAIRFEMIAHPGVDGQAVMATGSDDGRRASAARAVANDGCGGGGVAQGTTTAQRPGSQDPLERLWRGERRSHRSGGLAPCNTAQRSEGKGTWCGQQTERACGPPPSRQRTLGPAGSSSGRGSPPRRQVLLAFCSVRTNSTRSGSLA